MVNIKELRVGNYVENDIGYIHQIEYGYQLDNLTEEMHLPIKLTPKILEMCGFELKDDNTWYPYYEKRNTRVNELVEYCFKISTIGDDEWRWLDGNANVPVYSLHQLQNIYYSLTSSELQLKQLQP